MEQRVVDDDDDDAEEHEGWGAAAVVVEAVEAFWCAVSLVGLLLLLLWVQVAFIVVTFVFDNALDVDLDEDDHHGEEDDDGRAER